ncbi:MAG: hypothetical protein JST47_00520 [Bacteroidetes bacterium]|nr:hypothetical protein [Bacteroidota bacterium]MBS1974477.1 hypothetical protein [Bacteroidota bacterium]
MKPKNLLELVFSLFLVAFVLSGCYRNKIPFNKERAMQEIIPIEQARSLQKNFIASHERLTRVIADSTFLKNHFNLPNAETFNRDMIAALLNQDGADGIRIYYGEDAQGQIRLALLPVDAKGNDIVNTIVSAAIKVPGISNVYAQTGQAGENGQICPPCEMR